MTKMIQFTSWHPQKMLIDTGQRGTIPWIVHCCDEVERIKANDGRKAELRYDKEGRVSVWVNDVT
jgi:hypothetical protein